MFNFIERFKARQIRNRFFKDPIVSFVLEEWERRCVTDKTFEIYEASDALKMEQRWRERLIQTLSEIMQSENPFLKMREHLADAVDRTSYLEVLMKHRVDEQGNPISPISHPKISWRLSDYIFEIAQKEATLRAFVEANGENMNELLDQVLAQYQSNCAYMSAINAVRIKMKDYIEGEDWYKHFYISMCISHEDRIRKDIGIPSLFNENDQPKALVGLKYWSFLDFVKSGNQLPHRHWQRLYGSDFWK
jgi:hypothetical protein